MCLEDSNLKMYKDGEWGVCVCVQDFGNLLNGYSYALDCKFINYLYNSSGKLTHHLHVRENSLYKFFIFIICTHLNHPLIKISGFLFFGEEAH
jgi:hypothetical protein